MIEHVFITVSLCENELKSICSRYHFKDTDLPLLQKVYKEYLHSGMVSAYLKWCGDAPEDAIVLMTLGKKIDHIENSFMEEEQILKAYILECLSMEMLSKAYSKADQYLHDKTGLWCGRYIFPGSDCPLEGVAELVDQLMQEEIIYNEAYTLIPKKSVAYKVYLETTAPDIERRLQLCGNCSKEICESRMVNLSADSEISINKKKELNYGYQRIFKQKGGSVENRTDSCILR